MIGDLRTLDSRRPSHPALSVLVRLKNERPSLDEFWARLSSQTLFSETEVLFLDSGSTDGTLQFLEKLAVSIYQISAEDFCFGASCNQLMSVSSAPIACFLSAHVLLEDRDALQKVLSALVGKTRTAAYLRQVPNEIFGASCYERAYLRKRFPPRSQSELIEMATPAGFSNAASALTRDSWEQNPFPEIHGSEDFIWAERHLALGGKIYYLPGVTVMHSHGDPPEAVYERVRLNVNARKLPRSYSRAIYFFSGVLLAMLAEGSPWIEAFRYASSHARAYAPETSDASNLPSPSDVERSIR
jgi:glycosyltransferase involved in cell wall biosynthesis